MTVGGRQGELTIRFSSMLPSTSTTVHSLSHATPLASIRWIRKISRMPSAVEMTLRAWSREAVTTARLLGREASKLTPP